MDFKDKVLRQFIRDIEDTGGIAVRFDGTEAPVADPEWIDLAVTYRNACMAVGKEPLVVNLEGEYDDGQ